MIEEARISRNHTLLEESKTDSRLGRHHLNVSTFKNSMLPKAQSPQPFSVDMEYDQFPKARSPARGVNIVDYLNTERNKNKTDVYQQDEKTIVESNKSKSSQSTPRSRRKSPRNHKFFSAYDVTKILEPLPLLSAGTY